MPVIPTGKCFFVAVLLLAATLAACDSPGVQSATTTGATPTPPPTVLVSGEVLSPVSTATPTATVEADTPTPEATATSTPLTVPTATPTAEDTPTPEDTATPEVAPTLPPTATSTPEPPAAQAENQGEAQAAARAKGYDAYIEAAVKKGQEYHYSCEFDAAWAVLKTYGFDVGVDEQASIVGIDTSIEPRWEETAKGIFIYGGDITNYYSGDYKTNFLARSSGSAMRKLFEHFGLRVTPVHDRESVQAALLSGSLVWVKVPVDFKTWRPATWVMPDGRTYETVLGNDHAVVIMGFNQEVVVIRDVLGPTSTNWQRKYEYEVKWPLFLEAWGAQSFDGLAVAPPSTGP